MARNERYFDAAVAEAVEEQGYTVDSAPGWLLSEVTDEVRRAFEWGDRDERDRG